MRTTFTLLITFLISGVLWAQEIHTQSNAASVANEADATLGWTGGAVITSESNDVQHGTFAILVSSSGQASGRDVSYTFNVTSGQVYSISIWAKRAPQSYLPAFANWSGFANFSQRSILTTTWTQYDFELTANANTAVIRGYTSPINRGEVEGDGFLIDAISITPVVTDNQAPTAITDLTAGSTTSSSTSLSWSASTDNIGVIDYEVFQNGASIGLSGGATSFNVTNLTAATTYAFTAVAIDGAGNTSAVSNTVNVTTTNTSDTQAPTTITDLAAASTTTNSTALSWSASTDNVAVVDYEVFQDGVSIGLSGNATSFNVTNLTSATTYAFTAVALDAAGNTSAVSNSVNVTTTSSTDTQAPSAITDLAAGSVTSTTAVLSWSASTDNVAVTEYEVFQDGVTIGVSGGTTSFNVANLAAETSYAFTAVAIDGAGNTSALSNTVNVTTPESPTGGVTDYTSENSNLSTVNWQANNLLASGNVAIGTAVNPAYRLAVGGNVVAEEVRVALQANWPDYVFETDYELPSLATVERHIKAKKHLINIPSALEIEQQGIALGDMDARLLRKIEELTLYAIAQEKQIQRLREQNEKLKELTLRLSALELKINSY